MENNERIAYLEQEIAVSTALYESLVSERGRVVQMLEKAKHITAFDLGSIRTAYANKIDGAQNRIIAARSELAWIKRGGKPL